MLVDKDAFDGATCRGGVSRGSLEVKLRHSALDHQRKRSNADRGVDLGFGLAVVWMFVERFRLRQAASRFRPAWFIFRVLGGFVSLSTLTAVQQETQGHSAIGTHRVPVFTPHKWKTK